MESPKRHICTYKNGEIAFFSPLNNHIVLLYSYLLGVALCRVDCTTLRKHDLCSRQANVTLKCLYIHCNEKQENSNFLICPHCSGGRRGPLSRLHVVVPRGVLWLCCEHFSARRLSWGAVHALTHAAQGERGIIHPKTNLLLRCA